MDPLNDSTKLSSSGDLVLLPNEEIYQNVSSVTVEAMNYSHKLSEMFMILTTHRLIFKSDRCILIEIPLYYVSDAGTGGGIFHSPRIEVNLDKTKLAQGHPPHVIEYYTKILKTKP
jgi:hypothetical protein